MRNTLRNRLLLLGDEFGFDEMVREAKRIHAEGMKLDRKKWDEHHLMELWLYVERERHRRGYTKILPTLRAIVSDLKQKGRSWKISTREVPSVDTGRRLYSEAQRRRKCWLDQGDPRYDYWERRLEDAISGRMPGRPRGTGATNGQIRRSV